MPCSGTSCLSLVFSIRSHSVAKNVWQRFRSQLRTAAFHPNTSRCFDVSASYPPFQTDPLPTQARAELVDEAPLGTLR